MHAMQSETFDRTRAMEKIISRVKKASPEFGDKLTVKGTKVIFTDENEQQHAYDIYQRKWLDGGKERRGHIEQFIGWVQKKHDKIS